MVKMESGYTVNFNSDETSIIVQSYFRMNWTKYGTNANTLTFIANE